MEEKRNKILFMSGEVLAIKKDMNKYGIIGIIVDDVVRMQVKDAETFLYLLGDREEKLVVHDNIRRHTFQFNGVEFSYVEFLED